MFRIFLISFLLAGCVIWGILSARAEDPPRHTSNLPIAAERTIPARGDTGTPQGEAAKFIRPNADIVGVFTADCRTCHPNEVAAWLHSTHSKTDEVLFQESARDYAEALGIPAERLRHDALCVRCHATVVGRPEASPHAVYGISCESCHGPAGGVSGWLNRHHSYSPVPGTQRRHETSAHRENRERQCTAAGMVRADDFYQMAQRCYSCHVVDHVELVRAGHSTGSYEFEFASWSAGEVRHNFFLDSNVNHMAPSLWLESHADGSADRMRLKYVVGTFVELERALRCRANTVDSRDEYYAAEMSDRVRAMVDRLAKLKIAEGQRALDIVRPLLQDIETLTPNDRARYEGAANQISQIARQLAESHDGSQLHGADAALRELSPVGTPFDPRSLFPQR